ncbi:caspase family protein [uncultured Roseibium sp.]|uniref:caspase family protein n=1 Tax=uncultured Roseibium sp. TaxID=1936171 RepID=UPI002616AD30|nr:caspase family protein [uncultured Roseibium sp.]
MIRKAAAAIAGTVLCLVPLTAAAEGKLALIIGNAAYDNVLPLDNPPRDADLASRTFTALGFETRLVLNADASEMRTALAAFRQDAVDAEVAAIFFAGHGVQADNVNYLLATDTGAATRAVFEETAVRMEEFLEALGASSGVKLLIVDACRDNPFATTRSLEKLFNPDASGLSRVNHQLSDLMVIYSAQPNHLAYDGDGQNSPFMEAFSSVLTAQEEVKLTEALIDITNFVRTRTGDKQLPYTEGTLSVHLQLTLEHPLQTATPVDEGSCPADAETLSLEAPDRYLEYDDDLQALVLTDRGNRFLEVCVLNGALLVSGGFGQTYSPADLRNPDDGGAGYYFKTGDGHDAHLWFYADPANADATVEIGLYVDGKERSWITTGWVL